MLFKPKDIVSGDFYWCNSRADKTFIIISDCTGHGVPGAFMSMIGNALLNEIINDKKITHTVKIAELLDQRIVQVLHQHEESKQYDGMDISICCIDKNERKIHFTGACHSMYVFKDSLKKIKGNPYSLGGAHHQDKKTFSSTTIDYEEGLSLYFLTDGYCDQSGGVQKKRFASQQFEELLTSINNIPMNNQKEKLEEALEKWQGVIKQRDDILVVGIKC